MDKLCVILLKDHARLITMPFFSSIAVQLHDMSSITNDMTSIPKPVCVKIVGEAGEGREGQLDEGDLDDGLNRILTWSLLESKTNEWHEAFYQRGLSRVQSLHLLPSSAKYERALLPNVNN